MNSRKCSFTPSKILICLIYDSFGFNDVPAEISKNIYLKIGNRLFLILKSILVIDVLWDINSKNCVRNRQFLIFRI